MESRWGYGRKFLWSVVYFDQHKCICNLQSVETAVTTHADLWIVIWPDSVYPQRDCLISNVLRKLFIVEVYEISLMHNWGNELTGSSFGIDAHTNVATSYNPSQVFQHCVSFRTVWVLSSPLTDKNAIDERTRRQRNILKQLLLAKCLLNRYCPRQLKTTTLQSRFSTAK